MPLARDLSIHLQDILTCSVICWLSPLCTCFLILQHSKATVFHPFKQIHPVKSHHSLPVARSVIDTKTDSTPSVVEDKGDIFQVAFRDGWERTLPCYCHVQFYVRSRIHQRILMSHTYSRQCKLGRLVMLPSACGERNMAGRQPQTAKVIVMGSTQSLSPRQRLDFVQHGPWHNNKVLLQFTGSYCNNSQTSAQFCVNQTESLIHTVRTRVNLGANFCQHFQAGIF